ncbi:nuclear transport factor 2 family protein [Nocardia colli]|uniref:Nuclear transport factor 2 family protein n=1 Tax=Nocardia colli TaxID=2545717 RepID=A0A5N0E9X8_9NOCA|nr:nuclear transport factor 2 family protein [Nocardia colli]KAA8886232.1 nuclear transport factor 2 family protein [Nocardia colli]
MTSEVIDWPLVLADAMDMTTDIDTQVDRFIAAWNDSDIERRNAVVEALFSPDACYRNASEEFIGRARCREAVAETYDKFTSNGFEFARLGAASAHHDAIVFRWQMTAAGGGDPAATGRMFAVLDDNDRVKLLYQFLDA